MNIEVIRIALGLVLAIFFILISGQRFKWHPFFSLIAACIIFGTIADISVNAIFTSMQTGFGSLLQQIGLVVAVGAVLGTVLEKTGAMESLGMAVARLFKRKEAVAMMLLGLLVGIPVFADSGFIVLSRLVPTIAQAGNTSQGVLALSLSTGLLTSHTLVPPTPGPLTAAVNLGLGDNLGLVILTGIIFCFPVAIVAAIASKLLGKKVVAEKPEPIVLHSKVSVWKSLLPLLVPVLLITIGSFSKILDFPSSLNNLLQILGLPIVALLIGLALAILLVDFKKNKTWPDWIAESLKDAGIILLITGAGGSFGAVIKAANLEPLMQDYAAQGSVNESGILFLAFAMAAMLKTAQGSTTSAMIITSSIMGPIAISLGITSIYKLLLILMSIGGGGMIVSHANDSYFWVISKFGGIHHTSLLKSYTLITLLQGITVFVMAVIAMQWA